LKVATQKYEYTSSGITHEGQNVYAIIHAPRGDATEAIVLVAAWKTADGELNLNGVSLALTLARYFKRGSNLIAMHCGEGCHLSRADDDRL
jgi:glycosylphosphatidylinositol transamidase